MSDDEDRLAVKRALARISCPYCATTITAHQVIHPGHCGEQRCVSAHITKAANARELEREQEYLKRQEDVRVKASAQFAKAADILGRDVDDLLVAVVPYQNASLRPLPEGQRETFHRHVEKIVQEAFDAGPDDISMLNYTAGSAEEPPIVAAGCAVCQGFCCKRGGGNNHAFLTRQTIYHMRLNDPDLEPDFVIQHYQEALPEESVQDACVYQSSAGCTLSRKWRSSVCNSFYCHDIHAMHDLTGGRADVPLVIVGVDDDVPEKVAAFDIISGMIEVE